MKKWLYLILLSCLCCACRQGESIYHQYHPIEAQAWHRQDSLRFDIQVEPHLLAKCQERQACYLIQIRENSLQAYPYSNLVLAIESRCDSLVHIDTLDILQKENLPVDCPFELSADKFPYQILVYHLMQDEQLPNLQSLGLEIRLK